MMKVNRMIACILVVVCFVVNAGLSVVGAPVAGQNYTYGFDSDMMGWGVAWGGGFDTTPIQYSTDLSRAGNTGALRVNVAFNKTGWQEANVGVWLAGTQNSKFDLTKYEKIQYDLYVPKASWVLKGTTYLDSNFFKFHDHVDYMLNSQPTEVINGTTYAKIHCVESVDKVVNKNDSGKLVISLGVSNSVGYKGPIYIDDVKLSLPQQFTFSFSDLSDYDTVSGNKTVKLLTFVPTGKTINSIQLKLASGATIPFSNTGNGIYSAIWDTAQHADGFQTITAEGTTTQGDSFSKSLEVYVKNNSTNISLVPAKYNFAVKGTYKIKADITNPVSEIVDAQLHIGGNAYPMINEGGSYTVDLDTTMYADGVHTLAIHVDTVDGKSAVQYADLIVENDDRRNSFVTREGQEFLLEGESFYFTGTNIYELSFKENETYAKSQKSVLYMDDGTKMELPIPGGTTLTYEQKIDNDMLEMKRLGMKVVRTWAFNSYANDPQAFVNTSNWTYNEKQFKKLDYILDSAKRHGIRVIPVFENYWADFGGIKVTTDRYGLYKLEFFTNAQAKQMYKNYVANMVNRVNTVSGVDYKDDPAIFAWDLMNEPRIDSNDDPTTDKRLSDPTGSKLGAWLNEMSSYVKSLDSNHMVTAGSEGHGFPNAAQGSTHFGGENEGYSNDPIKIMNQPNIDFFSFHPYPNAGWLNYSLQEAKNLITGFVNKGHQSNKPVIMGEWGIDKTFPLKDPNNGNAQVPIDSEAYWPLRDMWSKEMLKAFREAGGNGSLLWSLAPYAADKSFSVTVCLPADSVEIDHPIVELLMSESELVKEKNKWLKTIPTFKLDGATVNAVKTSEAGNLYGQATFLNGTSGSVNAMLIMARYDSKGKLIAMTASDLTPVDSSGAEQLTTLPMKADELSEGEQLKLFVWDGAQQPYSMPGKITVIE